MSTEIIQIDPEGDVLIILPVKRSATEPEPPESSKSPIEKHFICSKKHLTFASPRAAKIFSSSFKEATKEEDGFHHWKFDATFDDKAFDLVLKIIHGKTRDVPQRLNLDLSVAVASVVDDLQCYDALNYYGHGLLLGFPGLFGPSIPNEINKTLVQYVFISFVFEHERLFKDSTKAAIRFSDGAVPTFELPIRADIPSKTFSGSQGLKLMREGHIEKSRLAISRNLTNALKGLEDRLIKGQLGCSHGCTSMLLGALIQGMKAVGLYPARAFPQFSSLTLDFVINSLRNIQSPTYFSAEEGSVPGKYSGSWVLSARSNTAPPPAGFGLFGGQPRTKAFGTSGLFGTAVANTTSSGATVADKEHDPATLVRHSCSLKDLLKPILYVAEAEIEGLNLADYPRP
ncbi:uncharacterized protein FTOL_05182 [Fusarium torulosum]|uniref:BTB domain-containing protein n=1 Tax=Fusarium torulosum TaxID=33205 RepID=A0AAE8SH14_9HYPO|nr:uncharacterized protein FTOL_05182 [Fusarium torulosum]